MEIIHDGPDEDRYYYREVEMPFLPAVGIEVEFCDCCSGMTIESITWNHASGLLEVTMRRQDTSRQAAEHHDQYVHWGFVEDEDLRGCCIGPGPEGDPS